MRLSNRRIGLGGVFDGMRFSRAALFVFGGMTWIASAFMFGFFLLQYIVQGAGLRFFPLISSGSILIGLVHVVGFIIAALLCFVIGLGICAHGLVPETRSEPTKRERSSICTPRAFGSRLMASLPAAVSDQVGGGIRGGERGWPG